MSGDRAKQDFRRERGLCSKVAGERILYIEDNFANLMLVKRVLMAEGYTVLEAENGENGLRVAKQEVPDLILMDINMPDIDGYSVTKMIREVTTLNRTPIIALTANVLKGDRERALDAGCDGYIQKPIDVDLLPAQIDAFLRQGRRRDL